jgi:hypothetical protein
LFDISSHINITPLSSPPLPHHRGDCHTNYQLNESYNSHTSSTALILTNIILHSLPSTYSFSFSTLKALERPLSGRISSSNSNNTLAVTEITPMRGSMREPPREDRGREAGEKKAHPTASETLLGGREVADVDADLKLRMADVSVMEAPQQPQQQQQQQQQQPRAALIIASSSYLMDAHTLSAHSSTTTLPCPSLSSQL